MLKKIEALRKQPKHIRNRYAFWTAFFFTLVIVGLWGSTLPARFSPEEEKTALSEEASWGDYKTKLNSLFSQTMERFGTISAENKQEEENTERVDLVELVASSSAESEGLASSTATSTVPIHAATTTATTTASSTPESD